MSSPSRFAVEVGVAVEEFGVPPGLRHADPVIRSRNRGEVDHHDDEVVRVLCVPDDRHDAVLVVVVVDPAEAGLVVVGCVERRLTTVGVIQVPHPAAQPVVRRVTDQVRGGEVRGGQKWSDDGNVFHGMINAR